MKDSFVQLQTDEDCGEQQFTEAVAYYEANGYPVESSSMDVLGKDYYHFQVIDDSSFISSIKQKC
jgi:hypothetical protein